MKRNLTAWLLALVLVVGFAPVVFARISNPGGSAGGGVANPLTANLAAAGFNVTGIGTLSSSIFSSANASTTLLSSLSAYFGATATSTFSTAGVLTLASPLAIASGGTAASSYASNVLLGYNGTAFVATGTPQLSIGYLLATSTTATSTFRGGVYLMGTVQLAATSSATSTTITLDWANTPPQVEYRIGTAATSITLINATTSTQWGSRKLVWVCNPNASAGALTWSGVEWIGTAPTQTTTANQCDVYSFDVTRATSTTAYKVAGSGGTGFQ